MPTLKFVDELPEPGPKKGPGALAPILAELRSNPGRWAELDRYPRDRYHSAHSRGVGINKRHPDIEYAARRVGDDAVLYLRAVAL